MSEEEADLQSARLLADEGSQLLLLKDAIASGDRALVMHAFRAVVRARGVTSLAQQAGINRDILEAALTWDGDGNIDLGTLARVVAALEQQGRVEDISRSS